MASRVITEKNTCSILWDPMGCSTPGFSVLHCILEFAQTHVHWVNDAIQPSHLLPTSPPALVGGLFTTITINRVLHLLLGMWCFNTIKCLGVLLDAPIPLLITHLLICILTRVQAAWGQGLCLSHSFFYPQNLVQSLAQKWKCTWLSHIWLFVTRWTIQSMEFSRPESWSE